MERSKLLFANYLDILFDGRNKAYGGYELRDKYSRRTRKACLVVVSGVVLAAAVPVIASSFSGGEPVVMHVTTVTQLEKVKLPDEPKLPPIHAEPPAPANTIKDVIPHIEPDENITELPPTIEDTHDKQPGLTTTFDSPDSLDPGLVAATGTSRIAVEVTKPHEEKPPKIVEQMPQFIGDLEKFLRDNLRYPESARTAGIEGRVGIQFIVNEDGSIAAAQVLHSAAPSLDAEALRVVRIMPKWKPGRQGGKAVRVYFTLPVTFALD